MSAIRTGPDKMWKCSSWQALTNQASYAHSSSGVRPVNTGPGGFLLVDGGDDTISGADKGVDDRPDRAVALLST